MGALRDTIRGLTQQHLDAGYSVMGQTLTAVGFVANTVPNDIRVLELPCSDVSNAGVAVGHALAGKRPIYIIRYQGFNAFNHAFICSYAAKSKAMWGKPCPMLVRGIAMEGGIGPVAGSSHHSLYYRMPGVSIYSPMTPMEYTQCYQDFMKSDDVVYLSEHRGAYGNSDELLDICNTHPDVVLFPISITRFAAMEAAIELASTGISVAVHHVFHVKPFMPSESALSSLANAKYGGVVLDDDYPDGIAKCLAHDLSEATGAQMTTMGLETRTAGFYRDNLPPSGEQIIHRIQKIVSG